VKSGDVLKISWDYESDKVEFFVNEIRVATGKFSILDNQSKIKRWKIIVLN